MSHLNLASFVAPPPNSIEKTIAEHMWQDAEAILGVALPSDYKWFIQEYGSGELANWFHVYGLHDGLFSFAETVLDDYRNSREEFPEFEPFAPFPEPGGVLPFASTAGAETLYWQTDGEPNAWTINIVESRGNTADPISIPGGLVDFFLAALSGELIDWRSDEFSRTFTAHSQEMKELKLKQLQQPFADRLQTLWTALGNTNSPWVWKQFAMSAMLSRSQVFFQAGLLNLEFWDSTDGAALTVIYTRDATDSGAAQFKQHCDAHFQELSNFLRSLGWYE